MSDIVERLRRERETDHLAIEAADEIELLQTANDYSFNELTATRAEIDRLRAALRALADYTPGDDHQSVLAAVRRALEPKP